VLEGVDSLGITKQYFGQCVLMADNWCLRVLKAWDVLKGTFWQCILVAMIGAFGCWHLGIKLACWAIPSSSSLVYSKLYIITPMVMSKIGLCVLALGT
jgi:hypothetical protein